jgi:hypothetical protein
MLDMQAPNTCFRVTLPRRQPDRRVVVLEPPAQTAAAYAKDPNASAQRRGPERAA